MTNDEFEAQAAKFYAETGVMAPGKHAGYYPTHTHEERREAYVAWCAKLRRVK